MNIRKEFIFGCQLIQDAAILNDLPQTTALLGQSIFHKFYLNQAIEKYDSFSVAMGSLLLASKVEEKLLLLRDIVYTFHYLYCVRNCIPPTKLDLGGDTYSEWKNTLIAIEKHILRELGFFAYDCIEYPHNYLPSLTDLLQLDKQYIQRSWNILNDSMKINLLYRYHPIYITFASILLASKQLTHINIQEAVWKNQLLSNDEISIIMSIVSELESLYSMTNINIQDCQIPSYPV